MDRFKRNRSIGAGFDMPARSCNSYFSRSESLVCDLVAELCSLRISCSILEHIYSNIIVNVIFVFRASFDTTVYFEA